MKSETVAGNEDGLRVTVGGVDKLEGCTARGNSDDDYYCEASKGSRIEGVDQSLIRTG